MEGLRRLPLTMRVPLMASALMILVGIVASQQVLTALARVQDARLRELARQHVEGLSVALGPLVLRGDVWEVYDLLDRASRATEGRRMLLTVVADDGGAVLAATDPRRAPLGSAMLNLAGDAQALAEAGLQGTSSPIKVVAPLVYQDRTVGQIATELDVSDLLAERRRAGLMLLLGNAVATGLIATGGYLAMRRMLRPISTLARHMSAGAGAPRPIPDAEAPPGDSEVTRLFQVYNSMAEAVEARGEAERRLAERERFVALGRLSSSLAHEINNPLGGLLNATDTIRSYPDRPDVVLKSADLLDRGLRHLRDVARATLDLNRYDRSGAPLSSSDFEDLRMLIAPEVSRQRQTLGWVVDLPDAGGIDLDAGPIRQIGLNLLLNASTAAGRGARLGLAVSHDLDTLRLAVEDDGPGLPESALQRLLTSEPVAPGGGVGLRMVRDLVLGLGGEIVHDRSDGRTRITVKLRAQNTRAQHAEG